MGGDTGRLREEIRRLVLESGAVAVGFARAGEISKTEQDHFSLWLGKGLHAGMGYLESHETLRKHTDNVLPGAQTVISMAFSYAPKKWRESALPDIAFYAYGKDYHDVIRKRLKPIVGILTEKYGGKWRICVDSAPLPERYWAIKAGIGIPGKNGAVIVDGAGSLCFLAEILTELEIEPDIPSAGSCEGCGKCMSVCPTGALTKDYFFDSGKCINYLTIEHRGEWNNEQKKLLGKAGNPFFGCDRCIRICPHNRGISLTDIPEFHVSPAIENLTPEVLNNMNEGIFKDYFRDSPIKRTKFEGIKRYLKLKLLSN